MRTDGALRECLLEKKDKLLKSIEFRRLRFDSKKVENKDFIVVYQNNDLTHSRLGMTVSKKVGCAVKRNRIKRIIREFFRQNRCLISKSVDMNIISKKSAAFKTNQHLVKSLKDVFIKIDS